MRSLPTPAESAYGWVIVLAGMLTLFASLGLGRFSLGMMLPAMGKGLVLSYAEMGVLSTANFCGYLVAVLLCGRLNRLLGARKLIFLALLLVGGSMLLIGCMNRFAAVLLLYALTGVGSALSNVSVMALVSTWFASGRRGRAAGVMVMGNGLGLLVSGQAVPMLNAMGSGWRLSWLVFGSMVVAISLICLLLVRNAPAVRAGALSVEPGSGGRQSQAAITKPIVHCGCIYFLYGFTYVIYVTFMVTMLVQERGFTEQGAGEMWSWIGGVSLCSGPLFGSISDRFGRKAGLMLVLLIQAAAYLLVAARLPMAAVYGAICSFGIVAWSVPTIMAALVGDYVGSERTAAAFGFITFIFGIGQIAGPAIAGAMAEMTGSFSEVFFLAAAISLVAVLLSGRLTNPSLYRQTSQRS